jgi:hypothetical protein
MASMFPEDRRAPAGYVDRIRGILADPRTEWHRIEGEPESARQVFLRWAVPLSAIGPVAALIGQQAFGFGAFGISFRPSLAFSLTSAVMSYGLGLVAVWGIAWLIDALAPSFGGTPNRDRAMKVAAYSFTAAWLAAVFQLIPMLSLLALVGLYSLYLLWLGLPRLMNVAPERRAGYFVAVFVAAIVMNLVIGAVVASVTRSMAMPAIASGTVTVPGLGELDTGKMEAAAARANAAAERLKAQAESGRPAELTPPATLQAMLPDLSGWTRGDVESQSAGAGGLGGSSATAHYTMGDDRVTVTVADIGAMGALAGLGAAMNVQSEKKTATGYESVKTDGDRMVTAKWDGQDRSGSYTVVVGSRFTVSADGNAPDDGVFRRAVEGVDLAALERMAR